MDEIAKLRQEVDRINSEIFEMLNRRFVTTNKIARIKKESCIELKVDEKRESEMLTNLLEEFYSYENKFAILDIFAKILEVSKEQQLLEVEKEDVRK